MDQDHRFEKKQNETADGQKEAKTMSEWLSRVINESEDKGREEGRAEGREEGREEGRADEKLSNLKTIMRKMKLSAQKAMEFLDIPPEDQKKYAPLLKESSEPYNPEAVESQASL